MTDVPLRRSKPSHPQTLHVNRCAWIDDEPSIVTLGYRTVLISEQDGRSFLHWNDRKAQLKLRKLKWFQDETHLRSHSPDSIRSSAASVRSIGFWCKFDYCCQSLWTCQCRRICGTRKCVIELRHKWWGNWNLQITILMWEFSRLSGSRSDGKIFCWLSVTFVSEALELKDLSMEEAQTKLKELMKKAQTQNVNLSGIQAIKKRGSLFRNNRKFMVYAMLFACFILHGYFGDLINSEKVS